MFVHGDPPYWRRLAALLRDRRARRFALVGLAGVGVNSLGLYLLHGMAQVPLVAASVLAVELAIVHNYLWNELWTFHGRRPSLSRFAKFNVTALAALVVNVGVVWLLASVGEFYLMANLLGIAAAVFINFTVSMTWIWGGRTQWGSSSSSVS
jgi:putative flippase GtrA